MRGNGREGENISRRGIPASRYQNAINGKAWRGIYLIVVRQSSAPLINDPSREITKRMARGNGRLSCCLPLPTLATKLPLLHDRCAADNHHARVPQEDLGQRGPDEKKVVVPGEL